VKSWNADGWGWAAFLEHHWQRRRRAQGPKACAVVAPNESVSAELIYLYAKAKSLMAQLSY
jgi:hypothetical protein